MTSEEINGIERKHMESFERTLKTKVFKEDLKSIENYIQKNYQKLHYYWGIKNKLKLAAERLIRFHIWRANASVDLYNTPLSSDVAFILDDCVINIDCKTIDLSGNKNDIKYIQCEANQANFENIPLLPTKIKKGLDFEGFEFFPMLDKFHEKLPVLSYFIFINYHDDGTEFKIKELELCCLPHNEVVKKQFKSNLISGYKTYKYLNELQAGKYNKYYEPTKNIKPNWIEFKHGSTKRYYDNKMSHPFDPTKPLVWGYVGKLWKVLIGGHTIRVPKSKIEKRVYKNDKWKGWVKVSI